MMIQHICFNVSFKRYCTQVLWHKPFFWKDLEHKCRNYGSLLYEGVPLYNTNNRGLILEDDFREFYEGNIGKASDPPLSIINGRVHGIPRCDFLGKNNERIEVKHGTVMVKFRKRCKGASYELRFSHIHHDKHDRLFLLGFFPDELITWEWDQSIMYGLSRSSRSNAIGDAINGYVGTKGHWQDLKKLPFGDIIYRKDITTMKSLEKRTANSLLYHDAPFSILNPKQRGEALGFLARQVYEFFLGPTSDSSSRDYDFYCPERNTRVEVKSSMMTHIKTKACKRKRCPEEYTYGLWLFKFQHIKPQLFDELFLVYLFPDRVEFWLCDKECVNMIKFASPGVKKGKTLMVYYRCEKLSKTVGVLIHRIRF